MPFHPRALRAAAAVPPAVYALLFVLALPGPARAAGPGGPALADARSVADVARTARGLGIGDRLHVEGLDLGKDRVGLDLERFRVFDPDGEVVVHGEEGDEPRPLPDHAYLRGRVIGEPGSLAVMTVTTGGAVRGIVRRSEGIWSLSPGPAGGGGERPLLAERPEPPEAGEASVFTCGAEGLTDPDAPTGLRYGTAGPGEPVESVIAESSTPYTVRVAIESDFELYSVLGTAAAVEEYAGDLIAFASTMYDDEVSTNLLISHLSIWSTSSDPWNQTSTLCGLLEFGRYWNDNRTGVDRTIAHFLSAKNNGGGIAWVGVLCNGAFNYNHGGACPGLSPTIDNYGGDYGYTGTIDGNFDIDSPSKVWDIIAVTHEIGHNFDSPHTHCYNGKGGSASPIDECYSGEFGCYSGATSLPGPAGAGSGTIMSYCHQQFPGFSNIAFNFGTGHPYGTLPQRVPDRMRAHVESRAASVAACFTRIGPPCSDVVELELDTITTTVTETSCGIIYAGNDYVVAGPGGDLTLEAFRVVLQDGFSVESGGSLTIDTL